MFNSFKYLFFFLLIIGGIIYLFNFIEHYEEYEYLSYVEYDMFYDLDSVIDWDSIDWDEVDFDLLDDIGFEEYFGLTEESSSITKDESTETSNNSIWILGVTIGAGILGYLKT